MQQTLHPHAVADIFPMMDADDYRALVDDMRVHGQREPIWLLDDLILDGRNRYKACAEIGLTPLVQEYVGPTDDASLIAFVVSLNLKRRHLTASQKAAIGLRVKGQLQEANPPGRPAAEGNGGNISTISSNAAAKNRDLAGEIVGVSGRYIDEAEKIADAAPDLFNEVLTGTLSIPDAKREIKQREKEQARQDRAENPPPILPDACVVEHTDTTSHLPARSFDLVLTDPPYGISAYAGVTKVGNQIVNTDFDGSSDWDSADPAQFLDQLTDWVEEWERLLRPGGALIAFTDRALISHLWDACKFVGLQPKNIIVWRKANPSPASLARRNLISATEFMVWAVKPGAPYTFNEVDGWDRHNVITTPIIGGHEKVDHPTQKPLAVLRPLIELTSAPGALILDPFAGSGSTGVAAVQLGRRAHLIERDADYVRQAQQRLAAEARREAA